VREPGLIPVYVVTHGWHTGLAVSASDVDFERWKPLPRAAPTRYLEIGWGDRDFYPAPGFDLWYAFKAIAWPTPSVLHIVGFDESPPRRFPESEVVELRVAPVAFERLMAYFARSLEVEPEPIAPGLYASGAFYPSREEFHLFSTCNVWVARGLREAGVQVRSSITTEGLMRQLRRVPPSHAGTANPEML
jgi:uncharacterized protein (TIGR02117 family)